MPVPAGLYAGTQRCAVCGTFIREGVVCAQHRVRAFEPNGRAASTTVEELPLEALAVPSAYQREERPHLVRKIIREFDPDLLGLLVVVRDAEGGLWILDGQHRWLALVELGYERARCEVLHDVPLERQAQIFSGRNSGRITPHPRDAFRADYAARRADVVAIMAILQRHGYLPPWGSSRASADRFVCVSTLREVQSWGLLDATVSVIRAGWPDDELATQTPIVSGLAACVRLYPTLSPRELAKRLARHSAAEVLRLARASHANSRERRLWVHVAQVVVDLYNRGRQAAYRLPAPDIPYDATRQWKQAKG